MTNVSFDEIIDTVSLEEAKKTYPSLSYNEQLAKNQETISPDKQRFYLSYYAKMTYEHVNFDGFSDENKNKFKSEIESLFANIQDDCKQEDFLQEMAKRTVQYIEDRHFEVGTGKQAFHGGEPKSDRTVGKNFAYRSEEERPKEYKKEDGAVGKTQNGEEFPIWEIGTMKSKDEDIMVVSIYDIAHRSNDYRDWKDFIEKFDDIYLKNKEKWDKGRIILDVRGNRGGEDKPIDHIAKRLYGNLVNTYKRCEMKDTELSNYIVHQHGAYKAKNYERE